MSLDKALIDQMRGMAKQKALPPETMMEVILSLQENILDKIDDIQDEQKAEIAIIKKHSIGYKFYDHPVASRLLAALAIIIWLFFPDLLAAALSKAFGIPLP